MLINFTCSNFRSFRDEQTLSMLAGSTRNHQEQLYEGSTFKLTKIGSIFGANASGKSNLYKAMRYSRDFILGYKVDNNSYFRLDDNYKEKPSLFEYEISVNNTLYRYGFMMNISRTSIESEWLWELSDNEKEEDKLIFQRNKDQITGGSVPKKISKTKMKRYLVMTLSKDLENDDGSTSKISQIHKWFDDQLKIIGVGEDLREELNYSDEQLAELSKILSTFDVGISSIKFTPIEKTSVEKEQRIILTDNVTITSKSVLRNIKKENGKNVSALLNIHSGSQAKFMPDDESDGTRRLLDLSPILILDDQDTTYVVDEIDRCLHPLVAYEFVREFACKKYNVPKQLIFTTHQTCIMDQKLLRRDSVWFVQKENDGCSTLYSLDDFKERFDKEIEKSYLDGRYDAIPRIIENRFE